MNLKKILLAAAAIASFGTVSAEPLYVFEKANPNGSAGAGDIKNVETSYDAGTGDFTWSYVIGAVDGNFSENFWLVVSPGENPKNDADEYAILYGDIASGNVYAYIYNGVNGPNSYTDGSAYITSFSSILSVDDSSGDREVSFGLNAITSSINSASGAATWIGTAFGEKIGIWFHATLGSTFTVGDDGKLANYSGGSQSWYDTAHQMTTKVPEPATLALLGLGLMGVGAARRRRSA